jgi:prepilin-type N-terminal cleavage/methylation domain-containing protein/prepilin-type processing-associated H-X9-DG protein
MVPVSGKPPVCGRSPLCRAAFTVIELMVVVAIILLLAAVLYPTLSKALEIARIASCGSNLRAQGISWGYYLADNNQTFPPYYLNMPWCYGGKQPSLCEAPPGGEQITPMAEYRPLNPYLQLPWQNVSKAEYFRCPSDHGVQAPDPRSSTYGNTCYDWFGNSYVANAWIMMQVDNPVTLHVPYRQIMVDGKMTWVACPFQSTMATIPTAEVIVAGDAQWMYVADGITVCGASFHNSTGRVNLVFLDGHVVYTQLQFGVSTTSDYSELPFPVPQPAGP